MIRLLLVDDQTLVRQGFRVLLEAHGDIEVVGEAENGRQAVQQVEVLQPDLVLLDVRMPEMDGVAVAQLICQQFEEVKVLMLSTFDDEDYVCRAILSHRPLSLWDSEYGCGHYVLRKHKKQAFFHDFLCDRGQYRIASLSQKQSHT